MRTIKIPVPGSVHPEMSIFLQGQGQFSRIAELDSFRAARRARGHGWPESNQGIGRRRAYSTSHNRPRRLTPRLRKRDISGWTLGMLLVIVLSLGACGKKKAPFIPKKDFPYRVTSLKGEWSGKHFLLKGNVVGPGGIEKGRPHITGARVYSAKYPVKDAPCPDCPIQYQGLRDFGPEVIGETEFMCHFPGGQNGEIYFFKVHLVGPKDSIGPSSNRISIKVK